MPLVFPPLSLCSSCPLWFTHPLVDNPLSCRRGDLNAVRGSLGVRPRAHSRRGSRQNRSRLARSKRGDGLNPVSTPVVHDPITRHQVDEALVAVVSAAVGRPALPIDGNNQPLRCKWPKPLELKLQRIDKAAHQCSLRTRRARNTPTPGVPQNPCVPWEGLSGASLLAARGRCYSPERKGAAIVGRRKRGINEVRSEVNPGDREQRGRPLDNYVASSLIRSVLRYLRVHSERASRADPKNSMDGWPSSNGRARGDKAAPFRRIAPLNREEIVNT